MVQSTEIYGIRVELEKSGCYIGGLLSTSERDWISGLFGFAGTTTIVYAELLALYSSLHWLGTRECVISFAILTLRQQWIWWCMLPLIYIPLQQSFRACESFWQKTGWLELLAPLGKATSVQILFFAKMGVKQEAC